MYCMRSSVTKINNLTSKKKQSSYINHALLNNYCKSQCCHTVRPGIAANSNSNYIANPPLSIPPWNHCTISCWLHTPRISPLWQSVGVPLAADLFFSVLVPAPRQLTLERQLNKSVLIGWTAPEAGPGNHIESYHVYVDGVLKTTVKATERTRALVEGVDSNRVSARYCYASESYTYCAQWWQVENKVYFFHINTCNAYIL